jgi:hypothetical protein
MDEEIDPRGNDQQCQQEAETFQLLWHKMFSHKTGEFFGEATPNLFVGSSLDRLCVGISRLG